MYLFIKNLFFLLLKSKLQVICLPLFKTEKSDVSVEQVIGRPASSQANLSAWNGLHEEDLC